MTDLLTTLAARLDAELRRDGRYHADCVFCGKPAMKHQKHFSFCEAGYYCFVCDAKGGLGALAAHLEVPHTNPSPRPRPVLAPPRPRHWQTDPRVLTAIGGALDTVTRWQAYKPLTLDTIARARLGVGVLPASRCAQRRLILPVFECGRLVALHGRAYHADDTDAKWLSAAGSRKDVLYGADGLRPGATVIICENMVDSLLAMQTRPDVVAVAGGGVSWRDEWTARIARCRPDAVIVWLDNDLAGWPNEATYARLRAAWLRERGVEPPAPRGPQIGQALLDAGVRRVRGPHWPHHTPAKADLGWALMQGGTP